MHRPWSQFAWIVASGGLASLAACIFIFAMSARIQKESPRAFSKPSTRHRPVALQLRPFAGDDSLAKQVSVVLPRFRPNSKLNWHQELHALRLWQNASVPAGFWSEGDWRPGDTLTRIFDDAAMRAAHPEVRLHLVTRHGLRFRADPPTNARDKPVTGDPHQDKTLSLLGLHAVPDDQQIVVDGHSFTVADLISETVANFQLTDDCAWTAMALAFYLPPVRKWTNKLGEDFSFDDLASHLTRFDVEHAPCWGCHHFHSLAVLLNVDETVPVLSPGARRRTLDFMSDAMLKLQQRQRANGSLGTDWVGIESRDALVPRTTPEVSVTGHLLETFAILPVSLECDSRLIRRACLFLAAHLANQPDASLTANFSSYSHAANALRLWAPNWILYVRAKPA